MTALNFSQRRTRRWWYAGGTAIATAAATIFMVTNAGAVLSGTTFEGGDGNLIVDGGAAATDWANIDSVAIGGLHVGIDDPSGTGDNSFGQGTKEDVPAVTVVSGSIPPNKSDLTRFYEAAQNLSGNTFLYLAWERSNVLGNANMDFEINQAGSTSCPGGPGTCTINRSNGDILVTYDFGGSGAPTLAALRWLTVGGTNPYDSTKTNANADCYSANTLPCWGDRKSLASNNSEGAVNTQTVTDPIQTTSLNACPSTGCPAETFGEASINLTGAGIFPAGSCGFGQATTFLKSRSSSSFTAEIKDFISPVKTPLSNCQTTLSTAPWIYPNDSATVGTNNSNINGSVAFKLYNSSANCTANGTAGLLYSETVNLPTTAGTSKTVNTTNGSNSATAVKVSTSSAVYWHVAYTPPTGDTVDPAATSNCVENINTTLTGDSG